MPITLNGATGISNVDGSASTPSYQGTDTNTGLFYPAADTVAIGTGGSERMRIDSSGNVGIGATSPASYLDVQRSQSGSTLASAFRTVVTDTSANISNTFRVDLTPSGSAIVNLVAAAGGATTTSSMGFVTRITGTEAERMRIDSSGNLLVGKTSATANGGVIQVSNGVTFPATQSAATDVNTLDDYEEGTWTPSGATGFPAGGAPSAITATYTKIGNMVSVRATFTGYNDGTSLYISGLPFNVSGDSAAKWSNSTPNSFTYERVSGAGFYCTISGTNATNKTWYLEATYRV